MLLIRPSPFVFLSFTVYVALYFPENISLPEPNYLHEHQTRTYSDAPQPSPATQASATPPGSSLHSKSSLNQAELKKFSAIAETWWDAEGPFKPLHVMNPTRLAFIRSTLCRHFGKDPNCTRPFEGLKFVDVGCGGGILSEPLARMGATVTGVDAVEKNIKIARLHADLDPMTSSIDYCCTTAGTRHTYLLNIKNIGEKQRKFDAVIALEVIEHVADPAEFCKSLSALTSTGGATLISTINRSMRAYATAILMAEYVLRWVQEMAGFIYNPLTGRWYLSDDISVNFIAYGTKNSE
ncbi:UNVERIFIED_CONTAM: Ubiquinone biosynthesis O-methyltransferase, mitochondrial [Sesamum angustifolium]|uniref:Ubiquinone biosynthesis O-methyltransferase, mitochondrial n=1 Tax=Sesamum angustifolium TaxID=2727405 RepID=A0AAW2PDR9_9LAMI